MTTIADLKPDPKNARKRGPRAEGMIVKSLQEVGAARSIVIDEDNRILAGNGTVQAAAEAGIERVQVVDADGETIIAVRRKGLTESQKKRLAVLDNRTGELAEWDAEILSELSGEIDLTDLWNPQELEDLLRDVTPVTLQTDPDAIPENVETRCKLGDLWQLGDHRLLCGDSTKREDVELLMGGIAPQMVWADPPYGISIVHETGRVGVSAAPGFKTNGKVGVTPVTPAGTYAPIVGDESTDTAARSALLLLEAYPKAFQFWWGANHYASGLPDSPKWIVWDKETDPNQFADAELAWTNQTGAVRQFRHQWMGMHRESERGEKRVHPTQKPVALAEWAFKKYGQEGDLILDPFVGSGMSIIAAETTGRRVYGLELSPEYCDVIIARFEGATGKQAELING